MPTPGKTCFAPVIAADRKSTRLNSSHVRISYAVFCLKKKTLVNLDWPRPRSGGPLGFGNTTPTYLLRAGNFSELLEPRTALGTDALICTIYIRELCNP